MDNLKILKEEFLKFFSTKTIDALFPPIIYGLVSNLYNIKTAIIAAVLFALITAIIRVIKGDKIIYSIAGILGVLLAGGYSLYSGNAKSFYLPKLLNAAFATIVTILSLLLKRPVAAYLSHISRGWPIEWFWHKDVKPAYIEVTFVWSLLFILKFIVLLTFYNNGQVSKLLWVNFIIGTPATITTLLLTYLYGSARLINLQGPSVEEFVDNKQPPYSGQRRGF